MENFDYYKMAQTVEFGKNTLFLNLPLGKDGLPEGDSIDTVAKNVNKDLGIEFPLNTFSKGRKVKDYWEKTEKIIYVQEKGTNYLAIRSEVFVIREEVKDEIEKVFGKDIEEYIEFLDINLVDLYTKEKVTDIGQWYVMNILKVLEGTGEYKFKINGKMYRPALYKEKVLDEKGNPKFPIYRMGSMGHIAIISKEFKKIIDKFDDVKNAKVYFYRGMYYIEDLVSDEVN